MNIIFEITMLQLMMGGLLIFLLSFWIGKVWHKKISDKKKARVDEYIETLNVKHAQQIESLQSELKVDRHALRLSHTQLIEKRAAVIDQCYKCLVDFDLAIGEIMIAEKTSSPQQKYDSAQLKFTAFLSFFAKNRGYFSGAVAKKVSKSHTSIAATLDLISALLYANQTLSNGISEELQNLFNKANNEIGRARQEIESELRTILQVEDGPHNIDTENALSALSMFH
jgi:hypothetical protein